MSNALAKPQERTRQVMIAVRDKLEAKKKILSALLPPEITPERMQALVLTSFQKTPALLNCSVESILGVVYEASKLALEMDTGAQLAHMIPYKGQATLQIGFRGMALLARRAMGKDVAMGGDCVRANDNFEHENFPPKLSHSIPRVEGVPMTEKERGDIVASYAWARWQNGHTQYRVVYKDELDRARAASRSKTGPWVQYPDQMSIKTAKKRLCKDLPTPDSVGHAIMLDDAAEDGRDQKMAETWEAIGQDDVVEVSQVDEVVDGPG